MAEHDEGQQRRAENDDEDDRVDFFELVVDRPFVSSALTRPADGIAFEGRAVEHGAQSLVAVGELHGQRVHPERLAHRGAVGCAASMKMKLLT